MSRIPKAPKTARVSPRAYPHKYIVTTATAEDAEEFEQRILNVGMGAVALIRDGRTLTFRTAEPLDLPENGGRPGASRDAIVRLSHALDADLRPETLYQIVVQTKRGPMSWHPYVSREVAQQRLPELQRLPIPEVIKGTWRVLVSALPSSLNAHTARVQALVDAVGAYGRTYGAERDQYGDQIVVAVLKHPELLPRVPDAVLGRADKHSEFGPDTGYGPDEYRLKIYRWDLERDGRDPALAEQWVAEERARRGGSR